MTTNRRMNVLCLYRARHMVPGTKEVLTEEGAVVVRAKDVGEIEQKFAMARPKLEAWSRQFGYYYVRLADYELTGYLVEAEKEREYELD